MTTTTTVTSTATTATRYLRPVYELLHKTSIKVSRGILLPSRARARAYVKQTSRRSDTVQSHGPDKYDNIITGRRRGNKGGGAKCRTELWHARDPDIDYRDGVRLEDVRGSTRRPLGLRLRRRRRHCRHCRSYLSLFFH